MQRCKCGESFTLFRRGVRGDEGLCPQCGWSSAEKSRLGRRGFLAMCFGAVASVALPEPVVATWQEKHMTVTFAMEFLHDDGIWKPLDSRSAIKEFVRQQQIRITAVTNTDPPIASTWVSRKRRLSATELADLDRARRHGVRVGSADIAER
jgi:hypothetical protein